MQPAPSQAHQKTSPNNSPQTQSTSLQHGRPDDHFHRTRAPHPEHRGRTRHPSGLADASDDSIKSAPDGAVAVGDDLRRLDVDTASKETSRASLDRIVAHENALSPTRPKHRHGPAFKVVADRRGKMPLDGPSPIASFPNGIDSQWGLITISAC